jgi:hypothetical protein
MAAHRFSQILFSRTRSEQDTRLFFRAQPDGKPGKPFRNPALCRPGSPRMQNRTHLSPVKTQFLKEIFSPENLLIRGSDQRPVYPGFDSQRLEILQVIFHCGFCLAVIPDPVSEKDPSSTEIPSNPYRGSTQKGEQRGTRISKQVHSRIKTASEQVTDRRPLHAE